MKISILTTYLSILFATMSFAQNKIDILINGTIKNPMTEIFRIENDNKIELRIYYDKSIKKELIVDSIKLEGYVQQQEQQQQQQQRSSIYFDVHKYQVVYYLKPIYNDAYISFQFTAQEFILCKGKYFYLNFIFDNNISTLKFFKGFKSKYKFILV